MELTLQILLAIVSLICFAGGVNLLIKGASYFVPKTTPQLSVLDNLFRFLKWHLFRFRISNDVGCV